MRRQVYSSALAASVLALCACSYGANAATISITSQDYTGNAPLEGTPTPASSSGTFSQSVMGSVLNVNLSPYAFNTGPGADGSVAATNAPYSALDIGGAMGSTAVATATYNVGSSAFTLLWGSPDPYNEIAFYTGTNGTGSVIDVVGGETTYYDGQNLACFSTTCQDTLFDLVTFTDAGGIIGSVVLSNTGEAAFEYTIPANTTPLPAALPLFATGLGALGLFGWRRKRKAAAFAA